MLRASLFWRINREERVVILYRLLFDFFHKLKLFYLINSYLFILYIYIVTRIFHMARVFSSFCFCFFPIMMKILEYVTLIEFFFHITFLLLLFFNRGIFEYIYLVRIPRCLFLYLLSSILYIHLLCIFRFVSIFN